MNKYNFAKKILFYVSFLLFTSIAFAEEWKSCDVGNSTATNKDAAIELGKIEKRISFFKKKNFYHIVIFFDNKQWIKTDLIQTGRDQFSDGRFYQSYASKNNKIIVQEFEIGDTMIVTANDDLINLTFFAKCK